MNWLNVVKNNKKLILRSSKNNNLKTIKIIGNFHGTLSYEKQKRIIKKFPSFGPARSYLTEIAGE